MFNVQTWVMLGIGMLFGALIASASFRGRFFRGFRSFLGGRKHVEMPPQPRQQQTSRRRRYIQCSTCRGTGRVVARLPRISDERLARWEICPDCKGEGEVEE